MSKPKKSSLRFYVYALLDPRKPGNFKYGKLVFKFKPFYIGKGNGGRANAHLHTAKKYLGCKVQDVRNPKKVIRIKKILKADLEPIVRIIRKDMYEDEAFEAEYRYIKWIGRRNTNTGPLLNLSDGGAGTSGRVVSEEEIERKVKTFKATITNMPEEKKQEWYDNISRAAKKRTPHQKEALGRKYSKLQRNFSPEKKAEIKEAQRIGMKCHFDGLSDARRAELSTKYSAGQKRRHANMSKTKKEQISEALSLAWQTASEEDLELRCKRISDAAKNQHQTMPLKVRRIRTFMLMVGSLLHYADKKDENLRQILRDKAERYYSKKSNLETDPKELKDKVRLIIEQY